MSAPPPSKATARTSGAVADRSYAALPLMHAGMPKPAAAFLQLPLNGLYSGLPDEVFYADNDMQVIATPQPQAHAQAQAQAVDVREIIVLDDSDDEDNMIVVAEHQAAPQNLGPLFAAAVAATAPACCICFDEVTPTFIGIKCGGPLKHHMCSGCVIGSVTHYAQTVRNSVQLCNKGLPCSNCDFKYTDFSVLPGEQITVLMDAYAINAATVARREAEKLAADAAAAAAEQAKQANEALILEQHTAVVRKIFQTFCPCCGEFYDGFTACCALTCAYCKAKFCAHCDKQYENSRELHVHIMNCGDNPKPGDMSMSMTVFKKAQYKRMVDKADQYLYGNVVPQMADVIWEKMQEEGLVTELDTV